MTKNLPGKVGYRTNYELKRRMSAVPKLVYDDIYHTLTDQDGQYQISRRRWQDILNDTRTLLYDYELKVFCEKLGCDLFQLMDPDVDLLKIYLKKKISNEATVSYEDYGLALL